MAENEEFDGVSGPVGSGGPGGFGGRGDSGFVDGVHRDEVERLWGAQAYADPAAWWRGLGEEGRRALQADTEALDETWQDAAARGIPVGGDEAQRLAGRHVRWLEVATEGHEVGAAYLTGLGDLYVADERFWPSYGDVAGAAFVRDALAVYAERNLR
ncbi:TipAS antibiotic-recognition domain-containing protein [Okibacterium fritillariae]|uniref:TipAS antibiotic-recognition domain-containing protein n=1 Tax=Okibacterium fritillariae TaxID=123320 RepID=A0A1T5KUL3_9MICO|nr:TipAS antibiotic-recognition domain-containing protein [Okibacterium fritillariae]SKC67387.1 TipAS antibiotic-recognition domain-containing protein [Okibacterium fritillariae]